MLFILLLVEAHMENTTVRVRSGLALHKIRIAPCSKRTSFRRDAFCSVALTNPITPAPPTAGISILGG